MKRLGVLVGILALLAAVGPFAQSPAAAATIAPCQFVAASDTPPTVPRGTPETVTVAAYCPDSPTITFSVLVNGAAYNLTLAETVPGPIAVATFSVPTIVLPPGTYTVLVFANWTPSLTPVAPFTVTSSALAYAAVQTTYVYDCAFDPVFWPYFVPNEPDGRFHYYYYEPIPFSDAFLAYYAGQHIYCTLEG